MRYLLNIHVARNNFNTKLSKAIDILEHECKVPAEEIIRLSLDQLDKGDYDG